MTRYRSALVTGGAGFIGTRLVAALAGVAGHVTVFDNLLDQVHGPDAPVPAVCGGVSFVRGDVRDQAAIAACVRDCAPDLIIHLAAETGTGQSFDEVSRYTAVNVQGTAYLAEALRTLPGSRRLILASSRAIYGEGACLDADGRLVGAPPRSAAAMAAGDFALRDASGAPLAPVATPEDIAVRPASIYASTKLMQEYVLAQALEGTGTQLAILRLQNVYGPGQSLNNPYTGVLSIFARQILDGKLPLNIYEDGAIVRDFVFVDDVIDAFLAAAVAPAVPALPVNIGSGEAVTILAAARMLLACFGEREDAVAISGDFRNGDVRHALADIGRARDLLGWSPRTRIADGIAKLARSIAAK